MEQFGAEDFQEGDKLVLEILTDHDWNLADYLREASGLLSSTLAAFDEQKHWNLGDLRKRTNAEMSGKAAALKAAQIIRFRSS